jgi:hypothetical protein
MAKRETLEERQSLRAAVLAGHGDRKELRALDKQVIEMLSALGFDPTARSRLGLAEVKAAIIECEPVQALELLDNMIAEFNPERDTAQTN